MIKTQIKRRIAENLGILSSDRTTIIEGRVTEAGIDNIIDEIIREELFPLLSDRFPEDFMNHTYPLNTYTASGVVDVSSSGTTLITTTDVFTNAMEGFEVENITDSEKAKIVTYTSATQVTLDTTIANTWDGDSIVVLGNEYTFEGQADDLKEVVQARIKYSASDTNFKVCDIEPKSRWIQVGNETYTKSSPKAYLDSVLVSGELKPVIGFLPFPDSYLGKFELDYIAKPPILAAGQEPTLKVQGISEVIISGGTTWGFRVLRNWEEAERYQLLYEGNPSMRNPGGKQGLIRNYKPFTRSGIRKRQLGSFYTSLASRII